MDQDTQTDEVGEKRSTELTEALQNELKEADRKNKQLVAETAKLKSENAKLARKLEK